MTISRDGAAVSERGRLAKLIVVAVAFLSIAGSCGLPVDGEVQVLDADEFPEVVFGTTTSTTTPPQEEDDTERLELYFVVGEGLGKVRRPFTEPLIDVVLAALQQSPFESEVAEFAAEGFEDPLQTALPAGLNPRVLSREPGSSLLAIEVDDEGNLRSMPVENPTLSLLVFSQIVCTITDLDLVSGANITQVEFHDSTGPIDIVDASGSLIADGRAGRADFDDCQTVRDQREAAAEAEADAESTTTTT